jgi:hypothetical protein
MLAVRACARFLRRMRLLALASVALSLAACADMKTSTGTDVGAGSGSSGGGAGAAGGGGADAGPTGMNCFTDGQSQVTLCEQIDTCPGLAVEPGALPNCGFRLHADSTLDLECICGDALCPIGVPTSCAQAQQLLSGQTVLTVCQQQSEGRCVPLAGTGTSSGATGSSSGGTSSTCDQQCAADCAGAPSCLQLCGC